MKYAVLLVCLFGLSGVAYGMEDDDLGLGALEKGENPTSDRASDIKLHFGELLVKYKKKRDGSDDLEKNLTKLRGKDFAHVVGEAKKRGGGLFGNDDKLIGHLEREVSRLRIKSLEDDQKILELERERYKKWTVCCSGGLFTLLAGSGFLGGKLLSVLNTANPCPPGTTTMFNSTTGP